MAHLWLTIAFMTMIGVNADPEPSNDPFGGFSYHHQFPKMQFPNIQMPTFPNIQMPTFPNFPQFTPMFPTIPPIPPIPPMKMPTADEIINKNVGSNEQYSGIVVQSSSGYTTDKDGKLVKTGGTTVITNNNGDVKKYSVGKAPPVVKINVVPPFKHPKYPEVEITEMPVMQPLPLLFPPIQPELTHHQLKKMKPGKHQAFHGSSTSSFSVSSNINGKKKYAGATNVIVNDNGKIDEQTVALENNSI